MDLKLIAKKSEPIVKEEYKRGMSICIDNDKYKEMRMGGDSIFRYGINALIIFLLTFSCMESAMTSFDIEYNKGVTVFFLVIFAVLMAFMHLNAVTKTVGYIIVILGFAYMVIALRLIINTGFSHIVNIVTEAIEEEFMLPIIRRFQLYYDDVEMSVSVCLIIIGLVIALLLNVAVSEYMNPVLALLITFPITQIGTYLDLPPSRGVMAMYVGAIASMVVLRRMGLGKAAIKNSAYEFKDEKDGKKIVCQGDPGFIANAGGIIIGSLFVLAIVVSAVVPDNFTVSYKKYIKVFTNTYAREFAIKGIRMFFDTEGKGGLNNGRIGDVGIIHMDYETDLEVTFVPLNSERQYLRNYIGVDYSGKNWNNTYPNIKNFHRLLNDHSTVDKTFYTSFMAKVLGAKYTQGEFPAVKSRMIIKVIDGGERDHYTPYYLDYSDYEDVYRVEKDVSIEANTSFVEPVSLWFYPYENLTGYRLDEYIDGKGILEDGDLMVESLYYHRVVKSGNLDVPKECKKAVKNIIEKYDLKGDDPELIFKIEKMFREDYEYSLMPGSTPKGEDYVSYFLEGNKKGFCAHFSSATIMILRELGIPARYVEGYVIDWGEIQDGEILDEDLDEWINMYGENVEERMKGLKVVKAEISDAKAHAWAEMYVEGFGWVPVDVTPPRNEEDENPRFGGLFNLFGDGSQGNAIVNVATTIVKSTARIAILVLVLVFILGSVFLASRMGYKRRGLRNGLCKGDACSKLFNYFLYIKLLLKAMGIVSNKSMLEREYIKIYADEVGMERHQRQKVQKVLEKSIYAKELSEADQCDCEEVITILEGYVPVIKKKIPLFRKIVYSIWYGI
ncbi:MAG: transglutaminase domain-containing protein [Lachnospiraceae bacterium]|nr:transglutaminase domain-containing protein [Lachnospiraceae bacterium]